MTTRQFLSINTTQILKILLVYFMCLFVLKLTSIYMSHIFISLAINSELAHEYVTRDDFAILLMPLMLRTTMPPPAHVIKSGSSARIMVILAAKCIN